MALFILRPTSEGKDFLEWDFAQGFVVRANDHVEARKLAQSSGGRETRTAIFEERPFWIDPALSTCDVLDPDGECCVIMRDFYAS